MSSGAPMIAADSDGLDPLLWRRCAVNHL